MRKFIQTLDASELFLSLRKLDDLPPAKSLTMM